MTGQPTTVAHFYARPAGGAASKAGPRQAQECFRAAGESFRGRRERKTDGCQTGKAAGTGGGCGNKEEIVAEVWEE